MIYSFAYSLVKEENYGFDVTLEFHPSLNIMVFLPLKSIQLFLFCFVSLIFGKPVREERLMNALSSEVEVGSLTPVTKCVSVRNSTKCPKLVVFML